MRVNAIQNSVLLGLASGVLLNVDLTSSSVIQEFIVNESNKPVSRVELLDENIAVTACEAGCISVFDLN
jgi:hypothetical protein